MIEAVLEYPGHGFRYVIRTGPRGDDLLLSVNLPQPVPGWVRKPVIGHSQLGYAPRAEGRDDRASIPTTAARPMFTSCA